MRRICNLSGTIMWKDVPIIEFSIVRGIPKCKRLSSEHLPIEFRSRVTDEEALLLFLDERVVPETRIGLKDALKNAGIPYFSMDAILRKFHGCCYEDSYWLRFEESEQWCDFNLKTYFDRKGV